ncbi:MAG: exosortase/archaeosortase family protein [Planctomycetaceae bacterium]|nr:exosortase/archaeosortase family protein [Planctomycetaceae bacterium]
MSDEYRSLLLFLNRGSSSPEQTATANTGAEHTDEYEFTMKLDRIERTPPAFQQASDDYAGGKTLHGHFVPQNVFEAAGMRKGMKVEVSCPKHWNNRIWVWNWWSQKEQEIYCRATVEDDTYERRSIPVFAKHIEGCYPVLAYLGLMLVLFPIVGILWTAQIVAKLFFPGLILILAARIGIYFWPHLLAELQTFDIFLITYVLLGGMLKFYWWAINLGDQGDDEDELESEQSDF